MLRGNSRGKIKSKIKIKSWIKSKRKSESTTKSGGRVLSFCQDLVTGPEDLGRGKTVETL